MPPPSRITNSNQVWIGRYSDPEEVGYFDMTDVMRPTELAIFERRFTIGDPAADSDEYLSSLIISDLSSGGQIEDSSEQTDTHRFHAAILDTRAPNAFGLPPRADVTAPSSATPCYPLGDDVEEEEFVVYQNGEMATREDVVTETALESVTGDLRYTIETFSHSIDEDTVLRITNSQTSGEACDITLHYSTGNPSATYQSVFGETGTANGQMQGANAVTVDEDGNIYVCDTTNHRIVKYDSAGAFLLTWGSFGTGNGQFKSPQGITYGRHGTGKYIWVADTGNGRIQSFSLSGVYNSQEGKPSGTQYSSPRGVVASTNNTGYLVADSGNHRIIKWSGTAASVFTGSSGTGNGQLNTPTDIAYDAARNVYVVDSGNHRVQKFDNAGNYVSQFGSNGTGNGEFDTPTRIAIDGAGNIYVVDSGNDRVQVFTSAHAYSTQFGTSGGSGNQFNQPAGIAVQPGYALVSDAVNNTVSRWTIPTGAFTYDKRGDATAPDDITLTRWDIRAASSTSRTVALAKRVTVTTWTPTTTDEPINKGLAWVLDGTPEFLVPGVDAEFVTGVGIVKSFCAHEGTVYALTVEGYLLKYDITLDTPAWAKVKDQTGTIDVRLNPTYTPQQLIVYFNKNGDETLFVISDRQVFQFNNATGSLQATPIKVPRGAILGKGVDIFRPGEDLWLTWGDDMIRYTSAGVIVPLAGLARDDGLHRTHVGEIVDTQAELSALYALVRPTPGANPSLHAWNGQGWHGLWEGEPDEQPTWMATSQVGASRLYWGTEAGNLYSFTFPEGIHNPRQGLAAGTQAFAPSGWLETARYDMAMLGFQKKASHVVVTMDNATATETVTIKYRTDSVTTWQTLGVLSTPGQTYLYFDPDGDGNAEGLAFEWIQFRWEFARGSDPYQTPLMRAFSFHFRKRPQKAKSFTFTVALPKENDNGQSADDLRAHLDDLIDADQFICLVHQGTQYRGDLTSTTGTDASGEEREGQRTLSFVYLPVRTAA